MKFRQALKVISIESIANILQKLFCKSMFVYQIQQEWNKVQIYNRCNCIWNECLLLEPNLYPILEL